MEQLETPTKQGKDKKSFIKSFFILILLVVVMLVLIDIQNQNNQILSDIQNQNNQIEKLNNQLVVGETKPTEKIPSFNDLASHAIEYSNYLPPMFPGYTISWKLLISEVNNFLFLYPENYIITQNYVVEYSPIILESSSGNSKIIVEKIEELDITNHEKSQEYQNIFKDIADGKEVTIGKYVAVAHPEFGVSNDSGTFQETDQTTKEVFTTYMFRSDAFSGVTAIRIMNVSDTDFRALRENFKSLR